MVLISSSPSSFPTPGPIAPSISELEKGFHFGSNVVSLIFQGFNIFSYDNFSGYQGFIPTLPATNLNYGRPSSLIDPGRRLQFGLRFGF